MLNLSIMIQNQKKNLFNLSLKSGINSSSLTIENKFDNSRDTDFDNEIGIYIGIEAEWVMPFNKNKWSILIDPTYQYFKSKKELPNLCAKINYETIKVPIGIRHYLFLGNKSKFFVDGFYVYDYNSKSKIIFEPGDDLIVKSLNNLAFGLGYKQNDKFSFEVRYQTSQELLRNYFIGGLTINHFQ